MKSQGLGRKLYRLLGMLICLSLLLQTQPHTAQAAQVVSPHTARLAPPAPEPGLGAPSLGPIGAPAAALTGAAFASGQLSPGWHLLSLPERPDDTAAAAVLASLSGSYTRAYAYNACDSADPWKLYDPAAPAAANDLTTIDHTLGFWVELTAADALEVAGTAQPSTAIALCPGWNLVGYPLAEASPVAAALASIAGKYSLVFAYDPADAADPWATYAVGAPSWSSDLKELTPGRGYWIYATAATTLTFTGPTPPPAGPDITLPRVRITVEPPIVDVGEAATLTVVAEDNVGIVARRLTVNGAPLALDGEGRASFTPDASGAFALAAEADDDAGNTGSARGLLRARALVDNGPPTVALTAPADASLIEALVDLTGTATDDDLAFYELQSTPLEADSFATFASGSAPVSNGRLARLDPRLFRAGPYLVRVCAEDTWGNRACSEPLQYDMASSLPHPGIVRLAFQDGFVDAVGMPLSIRRVYDSRDKTIGDFGVGWRLEVDDVKLSTTRAMGKDWKIVREGVGFPTFRLVPARSHRVIVTTPDGKVHRFELSIEPQAQAINPIQFVTGAFYDALPGTTSKLTAGGEPPAFVSPVRDFDGPVEVLNADQSLYDPNGYTLTLPDGRALAFARDGASRSFRLTSMRDLAGNVVTIGPNGISHSSGVGIGITRDDAGRITKITNPDGGERTYGYDTAGDLTTSTDYEAATTRYRYDDNHNLIQMIDPRGHTPGTMVYDEYGRLVAVIDADGNRVELAHNDSTNQEVVTDRLGNRTITTYDDEGNVIAILDAYNKETRFTYDANGHMASRTNPLGHTELFTHDAMGNLLTYTNALGKTWRNEYDAAGRLLTQTDPLSRTSSFEYDTQGNQTATVTPGGDRTEYRYNSRGALIGVTDALSGTVGLTVDDTGKITGYVDPIGRRGTLKRRADGQITRDQYTVGGQTIAYDYRYNNNGSLTGLTLPTGDTAAVSYDAAGIATGSTDPAGNTQEVVYNNLDTASSFRDIDGSTSSIEYDAEGQVLEVLQPTGERISRTLDRLGRPTRVELPDGQASEATYDDAGRLIREERSGRGATEYTYDDAGRVIAMTDVDGVTRYEWDAAGQLVAMINPLDERVEFVYDLDGNITETHFPDGSSTKVEFDALDRVVAAEDERGARQEFGYDAASQVTSARDTAGGLTTYGYNERGDLVRATTPGGSEWGFSYNRLGQMESLTFPWGGTERYTLDAVGEIRAITDPTGASVQFAYDPKGRITQRVLGPGHTEVLSYTLAGDLATVTGPSGTTRYQYATGGRLSRVDYPDGAFVAYEYDLANRTATLRTASGSTTYTYDTKGRLVGVVDSALGSASYSYDDAGRVVGAVLPDGSTTTYTRNSRGWITALRTVAADGTTVIRDEQISYDDAGNPLTRTEPGRAVTYTYDDAGRVAGEARSGADAGDQAYAYDADWNLVQNGARTLSYDGKTRLTSDGRWTSYTYDAAGRPLTRSDGTISEQFSYDALGRLVRVDRSGALPARVELAYGEQGLLRRVVADGVGRTLLWETRQEVPQLLEERRDDGTLLRRYVRGIGPIGLQDGSGSYVLHHDTLGSVRLLTGTDGAVRDSYAFSAYGEQTLGAGDALSPLRFAGEYLVPELGLYYLRSRFYDPTAGRFLTPDVLAPQPKMPQTFSPYLYAGANPARFTDPLGTFTIGMAQIGVSVASILATVAMNAFPHPFVWLAHALGFPEVEQDLVGVSFQITWSARYLTGGFQLDILDGNDRYMAVLYLNFGVTVRDFNSRAAPERIYRAPRRAISAGGLFGETPDTPGKPKLSAQIQFAGTVASVLLKSLIPPGGGSRVRPQWNRANVAVQFEIGGVNGDGASSGFFEGFAAYGAHFGLRGGTRRWLGSDDIPMPETLAYSAGISLGLNIPIFNITWQPNISNLDPTFNWGWG